MLAADLFLEGLLVLTPSVIVFYLKTVISLADFVLGDCHVNLDRFQGLSAGRMLAAYVQALTCFLDC